ncbi:MAG: hypothetical protein GX804_05240 [Lentisphaerae bacterium]|jgi:hypothetical protein|nr:hypothetical protein [Lentisphaerota bacterium]
MNSVTASIKIGADGIDTEKIVEEIKATVAKKRAAGLYDEARIARAEKHNLVTLKDDETFIQQYFLCLRQISQVDINDFEIFERRGGIFGYFLTKIKKSIWSLLKFYTYRMWSQQNQINSLLLAAIETVNERNQQEIDALKARIKELETKDN